MHAHQQIQTPLKEHQRRGDRFGNTCYVVNLFFVSFFMGTHFTLYN